ncbi:unnamed protein product, partial [Cuscuta europaea]
MRTNKGALSTKLLNISVAYLCKSKQLEEAEELLVDGIRVGVQLDVVTYNTLIPAYCQFFGINEGYSVLERMRESGIRPDVVTYNSLISGAARHSLLSRCIDLFDEMLGSDVFPDIWSYNMLMHCYFKSGKPDEGYRIFRDILLKGFPPGKATFNIL